MTKVPSVALLIQKEIIITMDVLRKEKIYRNIDSFKLINLDILKAVKTFSMLLNLNSSLTILDLTKKLLLMWEAHHFSKKLKFKTIKTQYKKNCSRKVIITQPSQNLSINRISQSLL